MGIEEKVEEATQLKAKYLSLYESNDMDAAKSAELQYIDARK